MHTLYGEVYKNKSAALIRSGAFSINKYTFYEKMPKKALTLGALAKG
ncbi:hypothetical protein POKO110462_11720 [Pontibacter korlensis]